MSVLPLKADIHQRSLRVRFVPKADLAHRLALRVQQPLAQQRAESANATPRVSRGGSRRCSLTETRSSGEPRLLAGLRALCFHDVGLQPRGRKIVYERSLNAGHRVPHSENHAAIL
jgi:hypothetical protein